MTGVYLLHFSPRYKHAGHYLGYADDIPTRVAEHKNGHSKVRLVEAAVRNGVKLFLVRTWAGDRFLERKLKGPSKKRTGSLARICPTCRPKLRGTYGNKAICTTQDENQELDRQGD